MTGNRTNAQPRPPTSVLHGVPRGWGGRFCRNMRVSIHTRRRSNWGLGGLALLLGLSVIERHHFVLALAQLLSSRIVSPLAFGSRCAAQEPCRRCCDPATAHGAASRGDHQHTGYAPRPESLRRQLRRGRYQQKTWPPTQLWLRRARSLLSADVSGENDVGHPFVPSSEPGLTATAPRNSQPIQKRISRPHQTSARAPRDLRIWRHPERAIQDPACLVCRRG